MQRLDEYLDYWLENVVRESNRPSTYEQYASVVKRFLKPDLGSQGLDKLSAATVRLWLNRKSANGASAHHLRLLRIVLSAALTCALREELVQRNVARLVQLPKKYEASERSPWSVEEAKRFLTVATDHEFYPAFLLLMLYGLRRGEVLGLRWCDVDFVQGIVHIRNQLQRRTGGFSQGPVKTKAGQRDLPLLTPVRQALLAHHALSSTTRLNSPENELVFTNALGQPRDPSSFRVSFQRLARRNDIRVISVHDVRHTTATLLKDLGVSARDAQLILGHADIATTQQIYQHVSPENRREALELVESALMQPVVRMEREDVVAVAERCRQTRDGCRQNVASVGLFGAFLTSVDNGARGGIRTPDFLFRSSKIWSLRECVTGVESALSVWRRQWVLGCVAVSVAVKRQESILGSVAVDALFGSRGSLPAYKAM
jgi:integrase